MPVRPLEEIALAFTYGAQKYEPDNYRRGTNWRRYLGAALRHTFAFARGEDADPETGLSHLAPAAACLMILRELQLDGQAYFTVVHDARRSFVMHAAGSRVTDIGTAFVVRAYGEDAEVKVVVAEGSVTFGHDAGGTSTASEPGAAVLTAG